MRDKMNRVLLAVEQTLDVASVPAWGTADKYKKEGFWEGFVSLFYVVANLTEKKTLAADTNNDLWLCGKTWEEL